MEEGLLLCDSARLASQRERALEGPRLRWHCGGAVIGLNAGMRENGEGETRHRAWHGKNKDWSTQVKDICHAASIPCAMRLGRTVQLPSGRGERAAACLAGLGMGRCVGRRTSGADVGLKKPARRDVCFAAICPARRRLPARARQRKVTRRAAAGSLSASPDVRHFPTPTPPSHDSAARLPEQKAAAQLPRARAGARIQSDRAGSSTSLGKGVLASGVPGELRARRSYRSLDTDNRVRGALAVPAARGRVLWPAVRPRHCPRPLPSPPPPVTWSRRLGPLEHAARRQQPGVRLVGRRVQMRRF